jgi:hypothetical protein
VVGKPEHYRQTDAPEASHYSRHKARVNIDDKLAVCVQDSLRDPLLPSLVEMGCRLPGKSRRPVNQATAVAGPGRAELDSFMAVTPKRVGDMLREAFRPELPYYSDPHDSNLSIEK